MGDCGGELQFFPAVDTQVTIRLVFPIVLMGWCIQEHQSKDIQVPHSIDASEESTVHLNCYTTPFPMAFCHLTNDEEDNSHGSTGQGDKHEELEPENQTLIVQPPDFAHGWETRLLPTDVPKYLKYHEAQKQKIEAEADTSHNDESHSQFCSNICSPDTVERICELHSSFTHIKYKEAERANSNWSNLLPIPCNAITLMLIHHVLATEDDPERKKHCIENALSDITK